MTTIVPFPKPLRPVKLEKPKRGKPDPEIKQYLEEFNADVKNGRVASFCIVWVRKDLVEDTTYYMDGETNAALVGLAVQAVIGMAVGVEGE
jgi:hypothetical protein